MKNCVDQFKDLIAKADTTSYIMAAALVCSGAGQDGTDIVERYTRSDFKRAIKELRVCQRQYPDYTTHYEDGIKHIRRFWLHSGVLEQGAAS